MFFFLPCRKAPTIVEKDKQTKGRSTNDTIFPQNNKKQPLRLRRKVYKNADKRHGGERKRTNARYTRRKEKEKRNTVSATALLVFVPRCFLEMHCFLRNRPNNSCCCCCDLSLIRTCTREAGRPDSAVQTLLPGRLRRQRWRVARPHRC